MKLVDKSQENQVGYEEAIDLPRGTVLMDKEGDLMLVTRDCRNESTCIVHLTYGTIFEKQEYYFPATVIPAGSTFTFVQD